MALADAAFSSGDIMRRLQRLESELRELRGARRLESSTIGAGGVRVKGAGGIRLQNGGGLTVEDGGDIVVDGGTFHSIGHDLAGVKVIGNGIDIIPPPEPTAVAGDGRMFAQNIGGAMWIEIIPPRESGATGENRILLAGRTATEGGNFFVRSGGTARVEAAGGSATLQASGDAFIRSTGGTAWLDGQAGDVNVLASGAAYVDGKGGQVVVHAGTNLFLQAEGQVSLTSGANQVYIDHETTTNVASCEIGTNGIIRRSTSARRFKLDIEDLDVDPDVVLQLRPRTWRDKHEVDEDPNVTHRVPGFVAEELADIGLDVFVTRNDDGEVESIAYDRLTTALIPVMQRQQQQIDALTKRLDALE